MNLDDCKSKPCDYGKCIDKINGYECACEPGYTGERWVEFTGPGGWSPELWEGQVEQVADGPIPVEQWCHVAYVGRRRREREHSLIHAHSTHKALTLFPV